MMENKQAGNFGVFDVKDVTISPTVLTTAAGRFTAPVRVNDEPVKWLAESIQLGIESSAYREVSTAAVGLTVNEHGRTQVGGNEEDSASISELFTACFKVALGARIAQVSGQKTQFDKKNFEYISLMLPVIATYGVYSDATEAFDIVPVLTDELKTELQELGCLSKDGRFVVPEWYSRAMLFFRSQKLMTAYGLPKDVHVDSPICFQLVVEDDQVVGRPGANVAEVLIATLVSSSRLTELFGAYRTLYCGIRSVRSAIENIGLKALHDLGA